MLLEELKDFSNQTSIHGINQIANDRATFIKRIIWLAIFVGSLVYAGHQLASTIKCKLTKVWIDEPVIDILDSTSYPIEEVEFPAVTLCPKSSNSDRLGPMFKTFDYLPHFIDMENTAERDLFQALNKEVDQYLRKEAEENNELTVPYSERAIDIARKLAMNVTNGKIILDKLWEEYGSFEVFHPPYFFIWNNFAYEIEKKVESINGSCLPSCNSSVERYLRSLYALFNVRYTFPTSPGLYLAYHFTKIFDKGSYIGFDDSDGYYNNYWPEALFENRPNELTLTFNKYLVNITTQLSYGSLNDVSILDLPSFGAMIDSLEKNSFEHYDCSHMPWSIQLNMAIYNHWMVINNNSWSERIWIEIYYECQFLKRAWKKYLNNPTTNNYLSIAPKLSLFDYTNFIKKNMTTFLVTYASSIKISTPKISNLWVKAANMSFEEIMPKDPNHKYYDKLVMGCTFKEPLMNHGANFINGCSSFEHTLTSNGLCQTFSGTKTSHLLKQKWKITEIIMAFENVFETISRPKMTFRGIGHSEGLNAVIDMKPHINIESASTLHVPYTIKISTRNNLVDQKRGLVELKPGYHVVIRVVPKVVETTKEFEGFDTYTRKCKLSNESQKLKFLKNYTKIGCEFECALKKAMSICKCLPWFYPNDFTEVPMCDIFAARCFDDIMSNEKHYKDCKDDCLEDCKGISYVAIPSYIPLNLAETCKQKLFQDIFKELTYMYREVMLFEYLTMNKWKKSDGRFSFRGLVDDTGPYEFCIEYVKNYISIVTIETPTDTVIKSTRVKRVSFNDQLAVIGGTLGLFSGMSLLSMVEIICFCLTMVKRTSEAGKTKLCKKTSTKTLKSRMLTKKKQNPMRRHSLLKPFKRHVNLFGNNEENHLDMKMGKVG